MFGCCQWIGASIRRMGGSWNYCRKLNWIKWNESKKNKEKLWMAPEILLRNWLFLGIEKNKIGSFFGNICYRALNLILCPIFLLIYKLDSNFWNKRIQVCRIKIRDNFFAFVSSKRFLFHVYKVNIPLISCNTFRELSNDVLHTLIELSVWNFNI